MNASDGEMYDAIADALDELGNDPNLRVEIVARPGFCKKTSLERSIMALIESQ
jgi:enoyl-CoA hydratase/carnithine racemase